ncbi:MAG: hypothetical protein C0468_03115 [Planctomyces sp.]|nr:hypothetical protein [Planctomyces sp.]MBA4119144.1 hypothetical protein [Isosphaera sp.]
MTPPTPDHPPRPHGERTLRQAHPVPGGALASPVESVRQLLRGLVDYAGLFPPAKLGMAEAVAAFARHRRSAQAWGLSRFICPVSRLDEWSEAASPWLSALPDSPDAPPPEPWCLSVLIDGPLDASLSAIERFNAGHHAGNGHRHALSAVVDTVEVKVQNTQTVELALERLPEELYPFFEVPAEADYRGFAACLAGQGAGAKLRTGGIVPEAFPSCQRLAEFMQVMHAAEVPFKATAGLHHPVRGEHTLTYEPDAPRATMHGFVNVFVGAAMLHAGVVGGPGLVELLQETDPAAFVFGPEWAAWRSLRVSVEQIAQARENFAICFGSCSYDEPVNELAVMARS